MWKRVFSERRSAPLDLSSPTPSQAECLKSKAVQAYVHQHIAIGWTLELIVGRLKQQVKLPLVCYEAIYQYIYCQAPHLIDLLPRHHRKRKLTQPYRKTGERIKHRTGLAQRPKTADTRQECWNWETYMIMAGDRLHGLNVLVDRKSRLSHISFLANKTAVVTKQVMPRRLNAYSSSLKRSITKAKT